MRLSRRAIRCADELRVPPTAIATLCDEYARARRCQVGDLDELARFVQSFHLPIVCVTLVIVRDRRTGTDALVDDSAHWNGELHVRAAAAGAFGPLSVGPAVGFEVFLKAEIEESVQVRRGDNVDRSAVAAIAAVGSTARDEFLPAEAHGAGTAMPGRHVNVYFVDKHNSRQSLVFSRRSQSSVASRQSPVVSRQSASGCTLMTRPLAP